MLIRHSELGHATGQGERTVWLLIVVLLAATAYAALSLVAKIGD